MKGDLRADGWKPLVEYGSLSGVPLEHPEVLYKCLDPGVLCGDTAGADVVCPYKVGKR